jgi:hypothetical protein
MDANGGRSVRDRLREHAEQNYDALVRKTLEEAITAETTRWGTCPNCQHRVAVAFPDVRARTKAVQLWLDQGYGLPKASLEIEGPASDRASRSLMAMARALEYAGVTREQIAAACEYMDTPAAQRSSQPPWQELREAPPVGKGQAPAQLTPGPPPPG